jgi:hypothetical protein
MKKVTISLIVLITFFWGFQAIALDSNTPKADPPLTDEVEQGRKLYMHILDRHPKLDSSYRKPSLFGAATSDPVAAIFLPINDWNSLSEADRGLLAIYAASLVNEVKANPFPYAHIPTSAPFAPRIRQNVSSMTYDSWGIYDGEINEDGQDMYCGKTILSGKQIKQ